MENMYLNHYTYTEVLQGSVAYGRVEKKDFEFFNEEVGYSVEDRCIELCDIFIGFCVINICKLQA